VAQDVGRVLELKNMTTTLSSSYIDKEEVTKSDLGGRSGLTNLVSESGLYKLMMRSDKPNAKPFQDWITRDVLPAIRKDGMYVMGE
jgi:prophage antirepressor-like protein